MVTAVPGATLAPASGGLADHVASWHGIAVGRNDTAHDQPCTHYRSFRIGLAQARHIRHRH